MSSPRPARSWSRAWAAAAALPWLVVAGVAGVACEPGTHGMVEVRSGDCVACHLTQYDLAEQPVHLDRFPRTCADCHGTDAWSPAVLDHDSYFPLRFAHAEADCAACHGEDPPVYAGTPSRCVECHAEDRDGAAEPPHEGFPDDCKSCHSEEAWTPAQFEHDWPLTGAHEMLSCASCHIGDPPVYEGTPSDCVDCHMDDYERSPFPGHELFSTECANCHVTTGWTPATGAHPEEDFPLTGPHAKYDCLECHNTALGPHGRENADCVGCHDEDRHARRSMDPKHEEVADYPTGEAPPYFCLDCHSDGTR